MNILIPMAGAGKRFADAGYPVPKPFIDVLGLPMIRRVMENIGWDGKYYLLAQTAHKELLDGCMRGSEKEYEPVYIGGLTEGAACTVLLAKEHIDNEDWMVIANSDQVVDDEGWFNAALKYFHQQEADCGIVCFLADHPKWSYVHYERGVIMAVEEKKVISNLATLGVYWFKKGRDFVQAAERMISKNIRTNNEFYVAPAINEIIQDGGKVVPFMVNTVYGLGTPEDLAEFIRRHP